MPQRSELEQFGSAHLTTFPIQPGLRQYSTNFFPPDTPLHLDSFFQRLTNFSGIAVNPIASNLEREQKAHLLSSQLCSNLGMTLCNTQLNPRSLLGRGLGNG